MSQVNEFIKNQIQRIFNSQKKKEISEKYNASFVSGGKDSLPPELEAEWLNQIEEFEEKYENAKQIPLLEFIGSPIIKKLNEINNYELITEYNQLENLLEENGIYIDFPESLDLQERYRFISEELSNEIIDDIRIQGMENHFIYEEFHPSEDLN